MAGFIGARSSIVGFIRCALVVGFILACPGVRWVHSGSLRSFWSALVVHSVSLCSIELALAVVEFIRDG